MSKRTFVRATNRQGHPIRGLYIRDGRYVAGFSVKGKWTLATLHARNTDDAIIERTILVRQRRGYLPGGPEPLPRTKEIDQVYSDARRLAQQVSMTRPKVGSGTGRVLAEAEGLVGRAADLLFEAWRRGG